MADDYVITARLVIRNDTATGLGSVERQLGGIERRVSSLGETMSRAFAFMGSIAGIGGVFKGIASINAEIDTTTRSIAGLYTAFTGTPIERSFRVAGDVMKQLQKDARDGVGELADYGNAYQKIYGATGGRADQAKILELGRNTLAAGSMLGVGGAEGMRLAVRDIEQALNAGVNGIETPAALAALQSAGISKKVFNAAPPGSERRLDMLLQGFKNFGPAIELMNKSWSVQLSTLQDNLKSLVRTVSAPIFERWTEGIRGLNDWFTKNRTLIDDTAEVLGGRMLRVWDDLISKAGIYAALVGGAFGAQRAVNGVQGVNSMLQRASLIWGGGSTPGRDIPAGSNWDANVGRWRLGGQFVGGAAGGVAPGPGGLAGLAAALSAAAGPAALVAAAAAAIAVTAGSVWGAMREWPSLFTRVGESAAFAVSGLWEIVSAFGSLFGPGSPLNLLGAGLLWGIANGLDVAGAALHGFAAVVHTFAWMMRRAWIELRAVLPVGGLDPAEAASLRQTAWTDLMTGLGGTYGAYGKASDISGEVLDKKGDQNVNLNGPITINLKTEANENPGRIALSLEEVLRHIDLYRPQARRIPQPPRLG